MGTLAVLGCPGDPARQLRVDLRTDLVPGLELAEVVVTLTDPDGSARLERYRPIPTDDVERGVRVGEFEALDAGDHALEVQLLRADGSRLGIRRRSVRVGGDTGVTVVFGRNCVEVTCPDGDDASATECRNGLCVPPECAPENPDACGIAVCDTAADCPVPSAECAEAVCSEGDCLDFAVAGSCTSDEVCVPDVGCTSRVPDAGRDAGFEVQDADVADAADGGPLDGGTDAGPECMDDPDCSDGVFCNGEERCIEGACADPERPVECDDGIACTVDSCDEGSAACAFVPDDGRCTAMAGGTCEVPGDCQYPTCTPASCTPGPCQTAECVGDRCERTDLCGGGEFCCAGTCAPLGCDDGNGCTDDACGVAGCVNTPNTDPCSDGDGCTVGDACAGGTCRPGGPRVCNDSNACTDDSCSGGSCRFTNHTRSCSDGDGCTVGDACSGGSCVPGSPMVCNDSEPCTDDSCSGGACQFVPHTRTCDDGNLCTSGDRCGGGTCNPGGPVDCDDGNPCTDDSCVPATGCSNPNTPMGTECGAPVCDPWGPCDGSCRFMDGNQFRSCRNQECNGSGACQLGGSSPEGRACTIPEGGDCSICGGGGGCSPPDLELCAGTCGGGCCTDMF